MASSNHGRSMDRRDVWVGPKPTGRLHASRGRRCKGLTKAKQNTPRSERRGLLRKCLTGPTLLEMSEKATTLELPLGRKPSSPHVRGSSDLILRQEQH